MIDDRWHNIPLYFKYRRLKHEAAAYVRRNGEPVVADAMFHLNHCAKQSGGQTRAIMYGAKKQLIKLWYERGMAEQVAIQEQTLTCHRCDGSGDDPYGDGDCCWKCDGTGIWRQYELYQFTFKVAGRRYIWHQPSGVIDYAVFPTVDEREQYDSLSEGAYRQLETREAELYYCIVLEYLKQQHVPRRDLHELMTVRSTIGRIWKYSPAYYRWIDVKYRVKRLLRQTADPEIGDIPF